MMGKSVMNRRTLRFSIGTGVLILLAAVTVLAVGNRSSAEAAYAECSLATLNGTYLFQSVGVVDADGTMLHYAEAGTMTFDGQGNEEAVLTASFDGVTADDRLASTATYELLSGCTFALLQPFEDEDRVLDIHMYTTPAGNAITYIYEGFSGWALKQ